MFTTKTLTSAIALTVALNAAVILSSPAQAGGSKALTFVAQAGQTVAEGAKRTFTDVKEITGAANKQNEDFHRDCMGAGNEASVIGMGRTQKEIESTVGFFQGKDDACIENLRENDFNRMVADDALGLGVAPIFGVETPSVVDVYDYATELRDDPANADKTVARLVPGAANMVFDAAESLTDPAKMKQNLVDSTVERYEAIASTEAYQRFQKTKTGQWVEGAAVDTYEFGDRQMEKFGKTKTGKFLKKAGGKVNQVIFNPANKWVKNARGTAMPEIEKQTEAFRSSLREDTLTVATPLVNKAKSSLKKIKADPNHMVRMGEKAAHATSDAAINGLKLATDPRAAVKATSKAISNTRKAIASTNTYKTFAGTKFGKNVIGAGKATENFTKKAANKVAKSKVGQAAAKTGKAVESAIFKPLNKAVDKKVAPALKTVSNKVIDAGAKVGHKVVDAAERTAPKVKKTVTKTAKTVKKVATKTKKTVKKAKSKAKKTAKKVGKKIKSLF